VDQTPPAQPGQVVISGTDERPVFTWNIVEGAISYRLQISKNADFSNPLIDEIITGGATYTPDIAFSGPIYVRVSANDFAGNSSPHSSSSERTFDTTPPQQVQGLTVNFGGASGHDILLTWNSISNGDNDFSVWKIYREEYTEKQPFDDQLMSVSSLTPLNTIADIKILSYTDATASLGVWYEYAVTAADQTENENKLASSTGKIKIPIDWDINGDNKTDILDVRELGKRWLQTEDSDGWNVIYNLSKKTGKNNKQIIDISDVRELGIHWLERR